MNKGWKRMASIRTIEIVTRKGKIAKCEKVRDHSNTKRIVYKLRFFLPNEIVGPITVIKIDGIYYVSNGEIVIGNSVKLGGAMKLAASFAIDKRDEIKPDAKRYSYSREGGSNLELGTKAGNTVLPVNRKAKRSRPIVFH